MIKRDSHGNIKRYNSRLVVDNFIQNDDIYYKETFSPISKKDLLEL